MSANLQVIVLAAGASRRLGQAKQLVKIDGEPALSKVASRALSAAGAAVSVVLGARAAEFTRLLQHSSATVLINRQWEEGLAASIRCGIASLGPSCDAALILLGDQVAVSVDDLRRLIAVWRRQEQSIAASAYKSQVGVPAIFPSWCFSELLQLRGDVGAKLLFKRHAQRLVQVPMSNAAIDLDTPEDLAALAGGPGTDSSAISAINSPREN